MPGLDPGIHTEVPLALSKWGRLMDCRVKPGNDEERDRKLHNLMDQCLGLLVLDLVPI